MHRQSFRVRAFAGGRSLVALLQALFGAEPCRRAYFLIRPHSLTTASTDSMLSLQSRLAAFPCDHNPTHLARTLRRGTTPASPRWNRLATGTVLSFLYTTDRRVHLR